MNIQNKAMYFGNRSKFECHSVCQWKDKQEVKGKLMFRKATDFSVCKIGPQSRSALAGVPSPILLIDNEESIIFILCCNIAELSVSWFLAPNNHQKDSSQLHGTEYLNAS
jgi:hypothetical protein